jgi:uncharacterized membrane protein YfcA
MSVGNAALYILVGLGAGVLSGLVGIGGGVLIIPALVLLFGFTQQQAQGTTLAMLVPPIGILAAWTYFKQGMVNLPAAGMLIVGFVGGGYVGARLAVSLPDETVSRIFGVFLLVLGVKLIVGK